MTSRSESETRSALVTGATRGIGHAVAMKLATQGYGLTIAARDADALTSVASAFIDAGAPDVLVVPTDMGDAEAVNALVEAHEARFGDVTVLVLAAGVGTAGPLAEYPRSRWDRQLAVNATSAFVSISQAMPMLRKAAMRTPTTGAKVIAISSIGGQYAEPGLAAYGASKAALIALCRSVNAEECMNGVTATAICPGYVDTEMTAWIRDRIPVEAMLRVDDVVRIVDALVHLSPAAVVSELVMSRASDDLYRA